MVGVLYHGGSMNNQESNTNERTRVLSEAERRQFEGVTIEETGDDVRIDETPTYSQYEQQQNQYQQYTNPRVKVIHLGGSSWLSRLILIIILAVIAAAVIFFGGIIVTIIGVIMLIGAIISFIFGLF